MIKTSFKITNPSVTVDEVKSYGLIDIDDRDADIEKLILASIYKLSEWSSIALSEMSVKAYLDNQNGEMSVLPYSNGAIVNLPNGFDLIGIDGDYQVRGDGKTNFEYSCNPDISAFKMAIIYDVMFHFENGGDYVGNISPMALAELSPFIKISI